MSDTQSPTPKGTQHKTMATAAAGSVATIVIWLLHFYQPELMDTAPTGLEAALTTLIATAASLATKESRV
jgi:hypothetical protein